MPDSIPPAPPQPPVSLPPISLPACTAACPITPPANVCISSFWQAGGVGNALSWEKVECAAKYRAYVDSTQVLETAELTAILTPSMLSQGCTMTVTSVDSAGMESRPSAPAAFLDRD